MFIGTRSGGRPVGAKYVVLRGPTLLVIQYQIHGWLLTRKAVGEACHLGQADKKYLGELFNE